MPPARRRLILTLTMAANSNRLAEAGLRGAPSRELRITLTLILALAVALALTLASTLGLTVALARSITLALALTLARPTAPASRRR